MVTAFVLSGGGSLGAVQVGMLQALAARGVEPDLLIGTSAGALNAGFVAGHGTSSAALDELAAIWAVFPSVHIDGRDLIDGGVADNAAVSQAVALGADVVYVLPTGYACALDEPPSSPLSSALQALTLLIEQRLIIEVAHFAEHSDIRVLPPLCPLSVSSTDFRHGALLVDRARTATERWLDEGGPRLAHPERFLSLHRHAINPCHGDHAA